MENLDDKMTWEKIWKQSWSEWDLKNIIPLLEERLKKIIKPKDIVTDYDKAEWESSVICVIHQLLPPRYFIRFIEEENNFVFQFFDSSQTQETQSIEVPYRKVFDWKVSSWEEASAVPTKEERQALLDYWVSNGQRINDIVEHFHISNSKFNGWRKTDSWEHHLDKLRKTSHMAQICVVKKILLDAGIKEVQQSRIGRLFEVADMTVQYAFRVYNKYCTGPITVSSIDNAIRFVETLIHDSKTYLDQFYDKSTASRRGRICEALTMATGIVINNKAVYDPGIKRDIRKLDFENYNKVVSYLNNVLTNLNQMKGEGK